MPERKREERQRRETRDPLMDVAKAREILNIYTLEHGRDMAPDELDAHRMGVESLLEGGAAGMTIEKMDVVQAPHGFTVQLDETDQKVLNATWPLFKYFCEMMTKIVIYRGKEVD